MVNQRGVDSTSTLTLSARASLAASLAKRHSCIVVLTGATDIISDGRRTFRVDNGTEMLGMITGTGCTLGTTISAMVSAYPVDGVVAAVAAAAMFGVAAEKASEREEVRGPGSFVPAFLDELYATRKATAEGDLRWLVAVRVQAVQVEEE